MTKMRLQITYAELRPGDQVARQLKRWTVLAVGERLPGDTRRPIKMQRVDTGEVVTFKIRDESLVWATRRETRTT